MRWRKGWLIGDYVPLESGLTFRQRRDLMREVSRRHGGAGVAAAFGAVMGILFSAIGASYAGPLIQLFRDGHVAVLLFLAITLAVGLGANYVGGLWFSRRFAPHILAELQNRGIELCTHCDHRLTGLDFTVANCPECGAARSAV